LVNAAAVKRSRSIKLVLIGGFSAGLTSCGPSPARVTSNDVFTNNHFVSGVGFYHAPFRAWYPLPYNHFDPQTSRYYHGGQWSPQPHESVVNISSPTPEAVQQVAAQNNVRRGGFGGSSGRWIGS
jgi:hypothetical protein